MRVKASLSLLFLTGSVLVGVGGCGKSDQTASTADSSSAATQAAPSPSTTLPAMAGTPDATAMAPAMAPAAALPTPPAGPTLTIAVVPKGTSHQYWKSVRAGAEQAAKDFGVTVIYKGPVKESDRGDQIAMVQQFVEQGVDGIVLAPLDTNALASPVAEATAKNIPVVIIDSALQGTAGKDFASFVATNNKAAGALGGEQLAQLLGGKGKVVLLRYEQASASTNDREQGFLDTMAKYPGIEVISKNQYGGATQGEAQTTAMNMVDKLQQADGIFCPNESSTLGMLAALDQANLTGKVKFVGFDATPELVTALNAKKIDVLIAQDPRKMGYEGVEAVVDTIRKTPPPTVVDTGTAVITRDNEDQPEIKAVLK